MDTEAMCASLFTAAPIAVEVVVVEVDTPLTCLTCIARFGHVYANACFYDNRPAVIIERLQGEYGERVRIRTRDGSTITTTPGLDPRFSYEKGP